ncbi:MAG: adenylate kinase [Candidatus Micrarchaeota archaeon]|nr:adenylate kinase [Candidatus Micrarchaeota archaeon]
MIIVMGTPGAGKSSVVDEFVRRHPDAKVVNFGTLMYEIAQKEYGLKDRDEMRNLPREKFRELQRKAAKVLLNQPHDTIVDTHASVRTKDGYYPGFPYYILSKIKVDAFVYIHASMETILSRRMRDKSRKRDLETPEQIKFHEEINLSLVCTYASQANAPVKFIINEDGKLEEAIKEFEESVKPRE